MKIKNNQKSSQPINYLNNSSIYELTSKYLLLLAYLLLKYYILLLKANFFIVSVTICTNYFTFSGIFYSFVFIPKPLYYYNYSGHISFLNNFYYMAIAAKAIYDGNNYYEASSSNKISSAR